MIKEAIAHYDYGITHDIFSEPVTSYAKLSVEALNKMNPLPVNHEKYFYGVIYRCPTCGCTVTEDESYCNKCGQHLDWTVPEKGLKDV